MREAWFAGLAKRDGKKLLTPTLGLLAVSLLPSYITEYHRKKLAKLKF